MKVWKDCVITLKRVGRNDFVLEDTFFYNVDGVECSKTEYKGKFSLRKGDSLEIKGMKMEVTFN